MSLSRVQLFVSLGTVASQAPLSKDSPAKNTGVGGHSLLQGIFQNQRLNQGALHCRRILTVWAPREAHSGGNRLVDTGNRSTAPEAFARVGKLSFAHNYEWLVHTFQSSLCGHACGLHACSLWELSPQTRDWTRALELKVSSPKH